MDNFSHYKASAYQHHKLCVVYLVTYHDAIIGFFALSMGAIDVKKLNEGEQVEAASTLRRYPGLILGNMGVDKRFRNRGLGKWICDYCVGLAIEWSNRIRCSYVFLQTSYAKKSFYEKAGFFTSGRINDNGRLWMYKRIYHRSFKRRVTDYVQVTAHVDAKVIRKA